MLLAAILGFVFGFVGSIPVAGPIAVLVFSRGLEDRARSAIYLAVGAAIAEAAYAYFAFWGFSSFLTRYSWIEPTSRVATAAILTGLGLRFALRKPKPVDTQAAPPDLKVGHKRSFFLGFSITALNPTLIATWTAAVTMLYSLDIVHFHAGSALPFSIGAGLGISSWFVTLLGLLRRFRARVSRQGLDRVIRVMGCVLIVAGLGIAARFAYRVLMH